MLEGPETRRQRLYVCMYVCREPELHKMLEHTGEGREVGTKTAGKLDRESHKRCLGYCLKVASVRRDWEAMAGCTLK